MRKRKREIVREERESETKKVGERGRERERQRKRERERETRAGNLTFKTLYLKHHLKNIKNKH